MTTNNFFISQELSVMFLVNVYCFIFIPSFSFNIIMINPNSSLICLSYFAPPIVHWSVSLGSKIHQIPFPIKEYITLLLACFEGNLFWFKTAKTERRCEREEENLKGKSKLKNQSRLEVNVVSQMHQNCFLKSRLNSWVAFGIKDVFQKAPESSFSIY